MVLGDVVDWPSICDVSFSYLLAFRGRVSISALFSMSVLVCLSAASRNAYGMILISGPVYLTPWVSDIPLSERARVQHIKSRYIETFRESHGGSEYIYNGLVARFVLETTSVDYLHLYVQHVVSSTRILSAHRSMDAILQIQGNMFLHIRTVRFSL